MASFHAELHLAGTTYRVVRCQYACHQPTDARGRVSAKVRHDLLHLALDVPDDDALLAWAAAPFKPLAGEVVFYDATQRVAHETIAFAAGQCVGYHETFESGASGDGAYVCQLTVAAPAFELRSGGPTAATVPAVVTAARHAIGGSGAAADQPSAAFAAGNAASAAADATATAVTDTAAVVDAAATAAAMALDAANVSSNLEKIELKALPKGINPGNGLNNCTHNVVAAVARLRGTDPEAVAPTDGKMREIPEVEELLGVKFDLDSDTDFHKSFREIESMPEGTIGVLLMLPKGPGGTGHIVTVVNNKGVATIIEAQHQNLLNPAELITSSTRAERRYGDEDKTRVFIAILPPPPTALPA